MRPGIVCLGERQKRQQAASLGVSPTVVARSQMSACGIAQQQVLTQRQQQEDATAVAQKAAAEKLQLEQQALERDYEQLRLEKQRSLVIASKCIMQCVSSNLVVELHHSIMQMPCASMAV